MSITGCVKQLYEFSLCDSTVTGAEIQLQHGKSFSWARLKKTSPDLHFYLNWEVWVCKFGSYWSIRDLTRDCSTFGAAMVVNTIHWFRKGLRLHDNPSLRDSIIGADTLRCVYILDPWFAGSSNVGISRWRWVSFGSDRGQRGSDISTYDKPSCLYLCLYYLHVITSK